MIAGAGLAPLLIQTIEDRLPQRLPMVGKTIQFFNNVLYSTNALALFCTGESVGVLVDRIVFEVDDGIKRRRDSRTLQVFRSLSTHISEADIAYNLPAIAYNIP